VLTPIDIVPGASGVDDHRVTNISRLLQSLDQDGFPENGISIPTDVFEALLDETLDLDQSISDFENIAGPLVSSITASYVGGARDLVPAAVTQSRLAQTLASLDDTDSGDGGASGTLAIIGQDTATIGDTFNPTGPMFAGAFGGMITIQMNEARPDFTAVGIGLGFFPGTDPFSISLTWTSTNSVRLYGISCNDIFSEYPRASDENCARLVLDLEANTLQFDNLVLEPLQPPALSQITLNGILELSVN
jgi:hypothetical protein